MGVRGSFFPFLFIPQKMHFPFRRPCRPDFRMTLCILFSILLVFGSRRITIFAEYIGRSFDCSVLLVARGMVEAITSLWKLVTFQVLPKCSRFVAQVLPVQIFCLWGQLGLCESLVAGIARPGYASVICLCRGVTVLYFNTWQGGVRMCDTFEPKAQCLLFTPLIENSISAINILLETCHRYASYCTCQKRPERGPKLWQNCWSKDLVEAEKYKSRC